MAHFLEDDSGNRSLIRVMSVVSLIGAITFASLAILKNSAMAFDLAQLFLIAAFAPKTVQKFIENKTDTAK
jgi:hypothetical protein